MQSIYFLIIYLLFVFSLIYQIKIFDIKNSKNCLHAFKVNNLSGLILFVAIILETSTQNI